MSDYITTPKLVHQYKQQDISNTANRLKASVLRFNSSRNSDGANEVIVSLRKVIDHTKLLAAANSSQLRIGIPALVEAVQIAFEILNELIVHPTNTDDYKKMAVSMCKHTEIVVECLMQESKAYSTLCPDVPSMIQSVATIITGLTTGTKFALLYFFLTSFK